MRHFPFVVITSVLASAMPSLAKPENADRPNVLLICIDDLRP